MKKIILSFILGLLLFGNVYGQWNPSTPVYIHAADPKILEANPNLYEYWHLTNHYFYRKPGPNGETYDLRSIDPKRFTDQYLNNDDRRYARDRNHPWLYRDMILDLEMNHIWKVDDPDWWRWTQDYINIMRMTKAAGKPVATYGVYLQAQEYQIWWNLGRWSWHLDPKLNPGYYDSTQAQKRYWKMKLTEYQRKEDAMLVKFEKLGERFNNEIDAAVLELYMGYEIPSTSDTEWRWYAWKYLVEQKIAAYQLAFPGKPIYVFIQPNFTVGWKPVPMDVWSGFVQYITSHADVDRVYVFNSRLKDKTEGWDSVLINGPDSAE